MTTRATPAYLSPAAACARMATLQLAAMGCLLTAAIVLASVRHAMLDPYITLTDLAVASALGDSIEVAAAYGAFAVLAGLLLGVATFGEQPSVARGLRLSAQAAASLVAIVQITAVWCYGFAALLASPDTAELARDLLVQSQVRPALLGFGVAVAAVPAVVCIAAMCAPARLWARAPVTAPRDVLRLR